MKKIVLLLVVFTISALSLYAQPDGDPPIEPPLIPIDGGISYLIAAGLFLGIKKLVDSKKNK